MAMAKIDRMKAEHEYITTNTSYRKLAEKYEVSENAMGEMARRHHWTQKRKEYRDNLGKKLAEKTAKREVDKLANLRTATDSVIECAMNRAAELSNDEQWESTELKTLASALKDLVAVQRDLHGLLSKRDELQLRQETNDYGETGVVYIPPLTAESDNVVTEGGEDDA